MANQRGEALLAAIGIEQFLLGEGRARVTQEHRAQAARLQRFVGPDGKVISSAPAIRSEVRRFLTGDTFDKERPLPDFRMRDALRVLAEPDDPAVLETKLPDPDPDDPDEAADLAVAVRVAVDYLRSLLPRHERKTRMGSVAMEPSAAVMGVFRRAWGVANRPMIVLEDLNEGTLARDQARAIEAMFPSIYATIWAELADAGVDIKAKRPSFELTHKRSKQLSVLLLDATAIDKPLAQALQRHFSEADETAKPGTNVEAGAAAHDLPIRKIEAR